MNDELQSMTERLVFKFPDARNLININLPEKEYGQREKVQFTLRHEKMLSTGDLATMSIAVFRSDKQIRSTDNMVSNILLTSDVPVSNRNGVQLEGDSGNWIDPIDLLLLTKDWRRFGWDNIVQDDPVDYQYPAELNGPILTGSVIKNDNGELPRSILINFMGKAPFTSSVDIDSDGIFHFEIPPILRNDRIHFFNPYHKLNTDQIIISSPFGTNAVRDSVNSSNFPPGQKQILEAFNANIQVSQIFREFNHINGRLTADNDTAISFYGTPDHMYLLDEYTRFETIKDLFIEYIRWAVLKRNNNMEDGFYVANDDLLTEKALTTIDGVPVFDVNKILNFDPLKIERIELITDYYFVGSTRFGGIVNFSTYDGDFGQQDLPEYMIQKLYRPLQRPRSFYSPDYNQNQESLRRIADYRNTLYWNPQVILNEGGEIDLEFYTSDDTGTYTLEINGITNSGVPIHLTDSFSVRDRKP